MKKTINFNVIGEAFNLVKDRWQPFVIAGLLAAVVITAVVGCVTLVMTTIGLIGGDRPITGFLLVPLMAVAGIAVMTLASVLQAGLTHMALKAVRGEPVEAKDLFFPLQAPLAFLGAGLMIGIGTSIGAMLCYFPGFIFAGLTMFTFCHMLDQRLSPVDALKASIETLKPQWLMATLFLLLVQIIGSLGSIACYVGLFFTMPVTYVAIAMAYRDLTQPSTAMPTTEPAIESETDGA